MMKWKSKWSMKALAIAAPMVVAIMVLAGSAEAITLYKYAPFTPGTAINDNCYEGGTEGWYDGYFIGFNTQNGQARANYWVSSVGLGHWYQKDQSIGILGTSFYQDVSQTQRIYYTWRFSYEIEGRTWVTGDNIDISITLWGNLLDVNTGNYVWSNPPSVTVYASNGARYIDIERNSVTYGWGQNAFLTAGHTYQFKTWLCLHSYSYTAGYTSAWTHIDLDTSDNVATLYAESTYPI